MSKKKEPLELKEACIQAAREVIAEEGVERLSLRDVARKLKVSHQAPYRHYPSRDHLLAEVMRRCFEQFALFLDARPQRENAREDLTELGKRYLRYALDNPLEYRLMFNTPWPAAAEHPELLKHAVHAFDILRGVMLRVHGGKAAARKDAELDALFIWSSMHGLASVMQSNVMGRLALAPGVRPQVAQHVMEMMGAALRAVR